jgi:hypothetical protein
MADTTLQLETKGRLDIDLEGRWLKASNEGDTASAWGVSCGVDGKRKRDLPSASNSLTPASSRRRGEPGDGSARSAYRKKVTAPVSVAKGSRLLSLLQQ